MLRLEPGLSFTPEETIALAIDIPDLRQVDRLAGIAKDAGGRIVKLGIELNSLPNASPRRLSELVAAHDVEWIADFKLEGTIKTLPVAIDNYMELDHPPTGITVEVASGEESLRIAQIMADRRGTTLFGVAVLSSQGPAEIFRRTGQTAPFLMRRAARVCQAAGVRAMVTSGQELEIVSGAGLMSLAVATRSRWAKIEHDDQKRKTTPATAIRRGATLLEVGRQVTEAPDMLAAYARTADEIREARAA